MHKWDSKMDCDPDQTEEELEAGAKMTFVKFFEEAIEKERQFSEFFKQAKIAIKDCDVKTTTQKYAESDKKLLAAYMEREMLVHNALYDNFDTPEAVTQLAHLVKAANSYLMQDSKDIKIPLVRKV
jgi:cysteinyl-tRNA synthetase